MINAGRRVDLAIFTLDNQTTVGKTVLEPGLQQIFRHDNFYHFKKIGQSDSYARVPETENIAILKILFSNEMFTGM